jgi:hypothetical protein
VSEDGIDERKNQHDKTRETKPAETDYPYQFVGPGTHCLTYSYANSLRDAEREHKCRRSACDRDLVGCKRGRADPAHQNCSERESPYFGQVLKSNR